MRLLGYTRVSTASQDSQLQVDALLGQGVQRRDVFFDVTSGSKTAVGMPPEVGPHVMRAAVPSMGTDFSILSRAAVTER